MINPTALPDIPFEPGDDAPSAFREIVKRCGDQAAFIFKGQKTSWSQLGDGVNRVANALIALGITKGDRVALLSRNSVRYVEAFFGALSAGACAVPLPTMASSDAVKLMIEDSAPKVLLASAEFSQQIEPFLEDLASIQEEGKIALDFSDSGWMNYTTWTDAGSNANPGIRIDKHDPFNIIYSSGTTGVPKGVTHTHAARKAFTIRREGLFSAPGMANIISTPFYSNTTMVTWLASMRFGTTSVLMEKFNPREFLAQVEKEKVTIAMLVPVQYDRIFRVEDFDRFDLSSMLVKYCTSAPLRPEVKKQILEKLPGELIELYGLTEGGMSTVLIASQSQDRLHSVGKPVDGCEVKVIGEGSTELEPGQAGELVGRQPIMMSGYHNNEELTREVLWYDKSGRLFFRSGDIGRVDKDGFVYLLDRKKDVIISGGLNVYAADLETILLKHKEVRDAAVIGVPSEAWGETPLAFVVLETGSSKTPGSILDWANARLGKSQRVSGIEILDQIPKTSLGKTLKNILRKPYWNQ
jgi:long-chain acyl-CoA synthetase